MAQEKYGFFQGTSEDPRSYDSADMAAALHALASNGVTNSGTNLQVTAEGGNMNTNLGYGTALIEGYYYSLQNDGSGVQAFTHTTEDSLNRIDRIVLRLNLGARSVTAIKLIGAAGSTPEPPALTRSSTLYDISLAQVYIAAGVATIAAENIMDEREDDDVCGLIAPESLRRTAVQLMITNTINAGELVSYLAQSKTTGAKTQARANIDAQQKITVPGILKSDGKGNLSSAVGGTDYASPVSEIYGVLHASAWSGAVAPFTQSVPVAGMTFDKPGVCVGLPAYANDEQFEASVAGLFRVSAQDENSITVKAHGEKPLIDIPVLVMIKG